MKKFFILVLVGAGVALGLTWRQVIPNAKAQDNPKCTDLPGDVDGDGGLNISDAVRTLNFLFLGGPEPLALCSSKAELADCRRNRCNRQLPATGASKCWDSAGLEITPCPGAEDLAFPGQDGLYHAGCPTVGRFIDHGDAVTDTCTGLMWEKDTGADMFTWEEALKRCAALGLAGHGDWRLPNVRELASLVRYDVEVEGVPRIDPVFSSKVDSWYWTSTTSGGYSAYAWTVWFNYGLVIAGTGGGDPGVYDTKKDRKVGYVRAVRTLEPRACLPGTGQILCFDNGDSIIACGNAGWPGQDAAYQAGCPLAGRFVDPGDGTVTDTCTGLMWQKQVMDTNDDKKSDGADTVTWPTALNFCDDLELGGHEDWRLPNVFELMSLLNFNYENPGNPHAYTDFFPASEGVHWQWTSTTAPYCGSWAYVVGLFPFPACAGYTELSYADKASGGYFVRAVRSVR